MDDKPSLKIKDFNDDTKYEFARYPCTSTGTCNSLPSGSLASADTNLWYTTKLTLNNQRNGPNDIYGNKLYRDAGVIAPLAEEATVRLYRDTALIVGPAPYTMLESINDKEFMKKHFGADYVLWEVENVLWEENRPGRVVYFKRDGGALEGELQSFTQPVPGTTPQFSNMNETSFNMSYFQRFLAAERIADNQDSACARNNNYFVAATPRENQGPLFTCTSI